MQLFGNHQPPSLSPPRAREGEIGKGRERGERERGGEVRGEGEGEGEGEEESEVGKRGLHL